MEVRRLLPCHRTVSRNCLPCTLHDAPCGRVYLVRLCVTPLLVVHVPSVIALTKHFLNPGRKRPTISYGITGDAHWSLRTTTVLKTKKATSTTTATTKLRWRVSHAVDSATLRSIPLMCTSSVPSSRYVCNVCMYVLCQTSIAAAARMMIFFYFGTHLTIIVLFLVQAEGVEFQKKPDEGVLPLRKSLLSSLPFLPAFMHWTRAHCH